MTGSSVNVLSTKLGLTPKVGKPSKAVQLLHRGSRLAKPGSHMALLRRLFTAAGHAPPPPPGQAPSEVP